LYEKVSWAKAFDLAGSLSAARRVEEALVTYCCVCGGGIDRVRKQVKKKKNDDAAATMRIVL